MEGKGRRNKGFRGAKTTTSRVLAAVALPLLLTLLVADFAAAKPVLEDRFGERTIAAKRRGGKIVPTPFGNGWCSPVAGNQAEGSEPHYLAYDARSIHPDRGTITFRLQRGNNHRTEAAFSFVDNNYTPLLDTIIYWDVDPPRMSIATPPTPRNVWNMRRTWEKDPAYRNILSPTILLPEIATGQWVQLAFTWGSEPGDDAIYVDGRKLNVELQGPSAVPSIIRRSSYLVLGAYLKGKGSDAAYSMMTSTLADLRVYDAPVNPFGLPGGRPVIASVSDDSFKVAGISQKLVAGDTVGVELLAEPGGHATFDFGKAKGIPMTEVPPTGGGPGIPAVDNGTYRGSYAIKPGDDFEEGRIAGNFVSADNVAAEPVLSPSKWTIETKPAVAFAIDKRDLPADQASRARVKLQARDANGGPVKGRHVKLTLSTTDEYTGTVGAGDFGKEVGASVETRWRGETDAFGEVEFDYTAGFAAKTVILSAKDLDSGSVAVDFITAYKEASIDIALTPVVSRAAARRGLLQYVLKVEASRTELTADGRSRSVIRATLLDPSGKPVEGDPVVFKLSAENGSIRTIRGMTDVSGVAIGEYVAGKKVGIVVVTALATARNASGNVSILLLADAPAKIYLKARPESLPADGFSRADLEVKVTDINDNPNADTKVEFRVSRGGGKLDGAEIVTDRFGNASNRYASGTVPGIATILATVRSRVPTDVELARAGNVLFAPYAGDTEGVRVEKWLKRKGEGFQRGEPLVEYTAGNDPAPRLLSAPFDGTMGEILVEYWDEAEVGQTLATLVPAAR